MGPRAGVIHCGEPSPGFVFGVPGVVIHPLRGIGEKHTRGSEVRVVRGKQFQYETN
jgi:hypothetical protein